METRYFAFYFRGSGDMEYKGRNTSRIAGEGESPFARGVHALQCVMLRKEVICSSPSSSSPSRFLNIGRDRFPHRAQGNKGARPL